MNVIAAVILSALIAAAMTHKPAPKHRIELFCYDPNQMGYAPHFCEYKLREA
jgi:hypothetical protein